MAPESWEPGYACRVLDADDHEALHYLFARCSDFFELVGGAPAGDEEVDDFLTDCPEDRSEEDLHCFGVFAGDDLLAAVSAFADHPSPGCWWISLFLVDPGLRREGMGRAFYGALAEWFEEQGARRVELGVHEPNDGGRRFWEQLGFEYLRPGPDVTERDGPPVATDVLYVLL